MVFNYKLLPQANRNKFHYRFYDSSHFIFLDPIIAFSKLLKTISNVSSSSNFFFFSTPAFYFYIYFYFLILIFYYYYYYLIGKNN